jgi:uncharacterized membrane protein YgdD (TMEM256/DUF423 family)
MTKKLTFIGTKIHPFSFFLQFRNMERQTTFIAGLFLMLSIIFGAFGAHALKSILAIEQLHTFEVGVRYQGFLAMGVLLLALNYDRFQFDLKRLLWAMLLGMFLFSFSLYAIVLAPYFLPQISLRFLGPITPMGGAISIGSWCVFLFRLLKYGRP